VCLGVTGWLGPAPIQADTGRPDLLRDVAFTQRLNTRLPLELPLREETGRAVRLGSYFGTKPVILVLAYYECRTLCPLVLDGLLKALRTLAFTAGREFSVVTVSIDPRDTPALAAERKEKTRQRYARPGSDGWHFLTAEEPAIARLAQAVGFRYAYDAASSQYAHASGLLVVTPQGRIARYFFGLEFSPKDLRLALVEASAHRIGSLVDEVLLFCYRYDPATGRYGVAVLNTIRLAGLATVLALGTFITVMMRREARPATIASSRQGAGPETKG
jgi:protein SCO1/2